MSNSGERGLLTITEKLKGLSFPNTGTRLAGSSDSLGKVQEIAELQI